LVHWCKFGHKATNRGKAIEEVTLGKDVGLLKTRKRFKL